MMNLLQLSLGLTLVLLYPKLIECEVHYITPHSSDPCLRETCLTLSQFAASVVDFLDSNTTILKLLPGNHALDTTLAVTNFESFKVLSNFTTAEPTRANLDTKITCSGLNMINFNAIFHLYISGIEFVRCGGIKISSVNNFTLINSYLDGQNVGRTALQLSDTTVAIISTYFISNSNHLGIVSPGSDIYRGFSSKLKVGGAIFAERSTITLLNSTFEGNAAEKGGAIYSDRGSNITIINSTFVGNHAVCQSGSGRSRSGLFTQVSSGGAIVVYHSRINSSHTVFNSNQACKDGGALLVWQSVISSSGDQFSNNSAGGNGGAMLEYKSTAHFNGSHFTNNTAGKKGGVVSMDRSTFHSMRSYYFNNDARTRGGVILASGSTINTNDNHFSSNQAQHGGVMSMEDTNDGSTINSNTDYFINNSAILHGGILHLTNLLKKQSATVYLYSDWFVSNSAGWYGGVMWAEKSVMYSNNDTFTNNSAGLDAGVAMLTTNSIAEFDKDHIDNNRAREGGVLMAKTSIVSCRNSSFTNNSASVDAGVMMLTEGSLAESSNNHFQENRVGRDGGVILMEESKIISTSDSFSGNKASRDGGVLHCTGSVPFQASLIESGTFKRNRANHDGGVVYAYQGNITTNMVTVLDNSADQDGGVFKMLQGSLRISSGSFSNSSAHYGGVMCANRLTLTVNSSIFSENVATVGGTFYISGSIHNKFDSIILEFNKATSAVMYLMDSSAHFSGNATFSENFGSLVVVTSNVTFLNSAIFTNNTYYEMPNPDQIVHTELLGGAITAFHSSIAFQGECHFSDNQAQSGGAVRLIKSRIDVHGNLTFSNNFASESGGGVYLYQSELTCHHYSTLMLLGNTAGTNGGGVYAFSSNINLRNNKSLASTDLKLHFVDNLAEKGGGVYLEMNSVIYIHRYAPSHEPYPILNFTTNFADYGGAIFNSDNTNFGTCTHFDNKTHSIPHECSIQILSLYDITSFSNPSLTDMSKHNVYFLENNATVSGSSLYGGSLDKCTVSSMAGEDSVVKEDQKNTGLMYLETISDIQRPDIGSPPEKVCFCINGQPDCDLQLHPKMQVERGDRIMVPVAVFDEARNPIKGATVHGSLSSNNSSLCRHQRDKSSPLQGELCSEFTFRAFSIRASDSLILQIENGPCEHLVPPQIQVPLQFPWCDSCPIGFRRFEDQELGCRCDCHPDLENYFSNCNSKTQTLQKESSAWIAYVNSSNHTHGFIIHPYCPLDYCKPTDSPVYLNFNEENGSNAQCANSRSGMLCGSCPPGLSLSLGSSRCLECPRLWPLQTVGIIVFALLAGLILVAIILAVNLTVAVGTLNGIIFYVNIVAANQKTFLPFTQPNFVTVFINWLNMEIGIDVCFFKGMDAHSKTFLQLAFPAYVIVLVLMIIVISEYSTRFAHLIGKKNPMATLTTLILLSYTKFLYTIIAAFSFATIRYPDGSSETVWLPDASIGYLQGRHLVLFLTAVFIVMLSVAYTALLFSWQWLIHCQHRTAFGWVKNQNLIHFLEPYHAPYTFKHRYWTGLLLLVRVVLYIISATNVSGDPRVALVSTVSLITFLLLLKGFLGARLYKTTLVDLLEVFMYFNLLMFSALSWYALETNSPRQQAIAYTSISITIFLLLIVILYHVYKYTGATTKFRRSLHFKKLSTKLHCLNKEEPEQYTRQNEHDTPLDFCQVIDQRAKTTYSVVELCKSQVCESELQVPRKLENQPISNPESKQNNMVSADLGPVIDKSPGELQSDIQVPSSNQNEQEEQLNESKVEINTLPKISDSSDECSDTPLRLSVNEHKNATVEKDPAQPDVKGVTNVFHLKFSDSDKSTTTAETTDTGPGAFADKEGIFKQSCAATQPLKTPGETSELSDCAPNHQCTDDEIDKKSFNGQSAIKHYYDTNTTSCTTMISCMEYRQTE